VGRALRFEADQQFSRSYQIDDGEKVTVEANIGPFDMYAVGVSAEGTTNASKLAFTLLLRDGKERRREILFSS
jgi:hypothetical protein